MTREDARTRYHNAVAEEAAKAIDSYLAGRRIPAELRDAIFLHAERRLERAMLPLFV